MKNSEYFYRETMNSLSDNEIIKIVKKNIIQASSKGLFFVEGEYNDNEIDTDSFIEYFKDLGFRVLVDYDQYTYIWSYKISWFKH
jgi:hypothetical protein